MLTTLAPGSQASADAKGGPSSHPTADADGGNHPASYGAHGKEASEEMKKAVPNNPDEISLSILAPSVEDAYKGKKDDPGVDPGQARHRSSVAFPQLHKDDCAMIEDVLAGLVINQGGADHLLVAAAQEVIVIYKDACAMTEDVLAELVINQDADHLLMAAAQEVIVIIIYKDACAMIEDALAGLVINQSDADHLLMAAAQEVIVITIDKDACVNLVGEDLYKLRDHEARLAKQADDGVEVGGRNVPRSSLA